MNEFSIFNLTDRFELGGYMYLLYFIISFFSSTIGAMSGIGGGVINRPLLDALSPMNAATVSFLSGTTVLAMSTYTVIRGRIRGGTKIDQKTMLPLAIGAAIGGLIGREIFSYFLRSMDNVNHVGGIQAILLLLVTLGSFVYTLNKNKIHTKQISNVVVCIIAGLFLGTLSSFLGIGGGPFNLVILYYLFSMTTKQAVENSLYIIFFSQLANLVTNLIRGNIAEFELMILIVMIVAAIAGAAFGSKLHHKLKETSIERLFIGLMVALILVNAYNIYQFFQ